MPAPAGYVGTRWNRVGCRPLVGSVGACGLSGSPGRRLLADLAGGYVAVLGGGRVAAVRAVWRPSAVMLRGACLEVVGSWIGWGR